MPILGRPMVSRTAFDCMSSCPDVAAIMRFASEYDKPRPGPLSETFVAPPLPLSALRCGLVGVTVARSIWICDRGRRRFEDAWCHVAPRVRIATGSSVSRVRVSGVAVGKFSAKCSCGVSLFTPSPIPIERREAPSVQSRECRSSLARELRGLFSTYRGECLSFIERKEAPTR